MHDGDALGLLRHSGIGAHQRQVDAAFVDRGCTRRLVVRLDELEAQIRMLAGEVLRRGRHQSRILAAERPDRDLENGRSGDEGARRGRSIRASGGLRRGRAGRCVACEARAIRSIKPEHSGADKARGTFTPRPSYRDTDEHAAPKHARRCFGMMSRDGASARTGVRRPAPRDRARSARLRQPRPGRRA